ncbi:MAG: acetylxylan esterase [Luteolibacter sp.]
MKTPVHKLLLCGLLAAVSPLAVAEDTYAAQREQVEALGDLTSAPAYEVIADYPLTPSPTADIKAIYYEALDWKGKPTKVFAVLGLPKNREGKIPAVVLVHGGGGKVFPEWVEQWTSRGYAAISMSNEGGTTTRKAHKWAGPERTGIYGDSAEILIDQWMYHAVADTILANSLMRSLPEVDADKVGLMGISWGGVITSTVIGIDTRFAFAIPTYGCGDLTFSPNQYGSALSKNEIYQKVWNPMLRLEKATMPTLWFSWPEDKHFPMNHFAASYHAITGDYMVSLVPKMGHGHPPPWRRPETYAFADSIMETGKPWCTQTAASTEAGTFKADFKCAKATDGAKLIWTKGRGVSGEREWLEAQAAVEVDGETISVTATVPEGATAWFVNLASGNLLVSSDYQEADEN